MKCVGITAVVVGIFLVQCVVGQVGQSALDQVNVDTYLKNTKLVEYHIRCLVYDGPCDQIGDEIKRLLAQVGPQCRGCTQQQRAKLGKIVVHWQRYYPQAWRDMVKKVRASTG